MPTRLEDELVDFYLKQAKSKNQLAQIAPYHRGLEMDLAGPSEVVIKGIGSPADKIREQHFQQRIANPNVGRTLNDGIRYTGW